MFIYIYIYLYIQFVYTIVYRVVKKQRLRVTEFQRNNSHIFTKLNMAFYKKFALY